MNILPRQRKTFEEIYARVDPVTTASLQAFRKEYRLQQLDVNGAIWEYISLGKGEEAILFLHGMAGAYDIWWQQVGFFQSDYRVVTLTYPAVDSLQEMATGVMAILNHEGISRANVVGSSLGGYFAQYLAARNPESVHRAVFANTFPPNDLIAEQNRTMGKLLPILPEWLIMSVLRGSFKGNIYRAANQNPLLLAYLMEMSYGRMSKAQMMGRYRCVIDPFEPPDVQAAGIPVLILEASNDPLVSESLRAAIKTTYPEAKVVIMGDVGHFPYLNQPEIYAAWLQEFLT